jgi:hypothetical protein
MIACMSVAKADIPVPQNNQNVQVKGVLVGPIFGPGGETTGMAIYDHLNGTMIAEFRDNTNSAGKFIVDPCNKKYQPVLVTGKFDTENLGQFASQTKVLTAQSIVADGPLLTQDISSGIADGMCPSAVGHEAFLKLEAAYSSSKTGTYNGVACTVTEAKTANSITLQVQSTAGGTQTCTLSDSDPKLSENVSNGFSIEFSNGSPGTFADPTACGITQMNAQGKTIVFISTPDAQMASCTLN